MKKILLILFTVSMCIRCSNDDASQEEIPISAPLVSSILLDDITNNGDGSDFNILFTRASDETLISEYRVFVVKASVTLNLEQAEAATPEVYVTLPADGTNKNFQLDPTSTDSDGALITESIEYKVYVLSVADGTNATVNALSDPSLTLTLAQTTIKITYIGNDGVYITDGENGVIIDALPGNLNGWKPVASGTQNQVESGVSPFNDIVVAMVTHSHGDHFGSNSINIFLANHPEAKLLAPPQAQAAISNTSDQVEDLNLSMDESVNGVNNGVSIRTIRIRHFNPQDGTNFATTVENYAFLIELGGKKILHIGDGDLSAVNFSDKGLVNDVDVILIPTFNFSGQLTTAHRDVLNNFINPDHIIGLHLASATPVSDVHGIYPNAIVFSESLQFVRF